MIARLHQLRDSVDNAIGASVASGAAMLATIGASLDLLNKLGTALITLLTLAWWIHLWAKKLSHRRREKRRQRRFPFNQNTS